MKNTLLTLSLLTMAFSQINASLSPMTTSSRIIDTVVGYSRFAGKAVLANKTVTAYAVAATAPVVATAGILGNQYFSKKQVQPTRMQRVQNALINAGSTVKANAVKAGSLVKSNVQAHPRIATGAGLVTLAGLSYAAYNKFGKAAQKPVVTKTETKQASTTSVVTPVVAPKAKKASNRLPGGYARRK